MTISPTNSNGFVPGLHTVQATPQSLPRVEMPTQVGAAESAGFVDRMDAALDSVAKAQGDAVKAASAYEAGVEQDLASVMIQQQVATLGFQMALNVRNKALGAYRDIMNMPV